MYVAGYRFILLNNLFMNHWGLQKRETRPKWRQMQHLLNNRYIHMHKHTNRQTWYCWDPTHEIIVDNQAAVKDLSF